MKTFLLIAAAAVFGAASANAAPAQRLALLAQDSAQPPPAGKCDNGEDREPGGACPVVDESTSTQRGFTLFSGSVTKPQAAPAKPATPTGAAVKDMRPAQGVLACAKVCDLDVTFAPGSAALTAASEARLAKFAASLRDPSMASKKYEIATHTDASGSADKNKAISQARAEAVKTYLVAHGVAATRLEAKGYGSEGLAYPNAPTDPRNRRVEARVLN